MDDAQLVARMAASTLSASTGRSLGDGVKGSARGSNIPSVAASVARADHALQGMLGDLETIGVCLSLRCCLASV